MAFANLALARMGSHLSIGKSTGGPSALEKEMEKWKSCEIPSKIKVSLAFQLGSRGRIIPSQTVLYYTAEDTLELVWQRISGYRGGAPLWPEGFAELVESGEAMPYLMHYEGSVGGAGKKLEAPIWRHTPLRTKFSEISRGPNPAVPLLLRLVQTEAFRPARSADLRTQPAEVKLAATGGFAQRDEQSGAWNLKDFAPGLTLGEELNQVSWESDSTQDVLNVAAKDFAAGLQDKDDMMPLEWARAALRSTGTSGTPLWESLLCGNRRRELLANKETRSVSATPETMTPTSSMTTSLSSWSTCTKTPTMSTKSSEPTRPPGTFLPVSIPLPSGLLKEVPMAPAWLRVNPLFLRPAEPVTITDSVPNLQVKELTRNSDMNASPVSMIESNLPEKWKVDQPLAVPAPDLPEQLFDAVTRGDVHAIQDLLKETDDINKTTQRGSHILFRAVIKAQGPEIVLLLLNARADPRKRDDKGNTVMHFWARATVGRNHLVTIGKLLIQAGADIDAQRATDGMSPLHHVAVGHNNRRGWLDFHKARFLLRHGANLRITTQLGQTPFDLLTKDSRTSTKKISQLLQYGLGAGPGGWPSCDHSGCIWCS
mmetsp:Transcript_61516/g.133119  ORF Transcript_61516/g.133119 Transcript_61516/m.133119 type:complete len:597 (-) Transcript_61516:228-2018(-)